MKEFPGDVLRNPPVRMLLVEENQHPEDDRDSHLSQKSALEGMRSTRRRTMVHA